MAISTYSVIMAVLCSDIFIILLYILRKKTNINKLLRNHFTDNPLHPDSIPYAVPSGI